MYRPPIQSKIVFIRRYMFMKILLLNRRDCSGEIEFIYDLIRTICNPVQLKVFQK